ncbi:hypothetical protein J4Q44_G00281760 [Coregonus suidteri]|uniref:Uncharacterized protein n=1 Tax=Coregonus suidteri TaxID=861788 RepID=A0AAN8L229_9TELE
MVRWCSAAPRSLMLFTCAKERDRGNHISGYLNAAQPQRQNPRRWVREIFNIRFGQYEHHTMTMSPVQAVHWPSLSSPTSELNQVCQCLAGTKACTPSSSSGPGLETTARTSKRMA